MKVLDSNGLKRAIANIREEYTAGSPAFHAFVPQFFRNLANGGIAALRRRGIDVSEYENLSDEETVSKVLSWLSDELGAFGTLSAPGVTAVWGLMKAASEFLTNHHPAELYDSQTEAFLAELAKMYDSSGMLHQALKTGAQAAYSELYPEGDAPEFSLSDCNALGTLSTMGEDAAVELLKMLVKTWEYWQEQGGAVGMAVSVKRMEDVLSVTDKELGVLPVFYKGICEGANEYCEAHDIELQLPEEITREFVTDASNMEFIAKTIGQGVAAATMCEYIVGTFDERITKALNFAILYERSCMRGGSGTMYDISLRSPLSPLLEAGGAVWDDDTNSYTYKGEKGLSVWDVVDRFAADITAAREPEIISDAEIDALFGKKTVENENT